METCLSSWGFSRAWQGNNRKGGRKQARREPKGGEEGGAARPLGLGGSPQWSGGGRARSKLTEGDSFVQKSAYALGFGRDVF